MSINFIKGELANAIELHDHLSSELENSNVEAFTDEDWQSRLRSIGLETVQFSKKVQTIDDPRLLNLINKKQCKLKKHALWKKRNKKQKSNLKRKRVRRIKDIEWKVTITVEQKPTHNDKRNKLELKAKELSHMLSKLTQLRSLRRKNLEAKGHFFPEEGDAFYEQVKELNEKKSTGEEEKEQEEEQEVGLIIDPKDKWNSYDVDEKAYRFWTCQTVDSLLKVRRMWDQYIIDQDGDKVPPTFVSPSAPANYIWASYLY